MCLSISYAAAACSGKSTRCPIKTVPRFHRFFCAICVICGLLLPINPIAVVATEGAVITKAARLQALRRVNDETSGADTVEKFPNTRDYLLANSLPVFIREHRILCAQVQVVQLARTIQTLVPTILTAANYVVSAAGDRLVRQDQLFECFEIDRKLQA